TQFNVTGSAADATTLLASTNQDLSIGTEDVIVAATSFVNPTTVKVTLAHPVQSAHLITDVVTPLKLQAAGSPQSLIMAGNGGDSIVYLDALGGNFTNTTHLAVIDPGAFPNQEVRRIGALSLFTPALPPYVDYPVGSVIEHVTVADDTRKVAAAA